MAFKLAPKNEIKTKVTVDVLGDLGKTEKSEFIATFKKLPNSEVRAAYDSMRTGEADENDILTQNLIGWEGVKNESGEDLSFTPENVNELLNMVEARKAVAEAFWAVQIGEAKRKN